jgi:multidrug efflux system membrane fusion protein
LFTNEVKVSENSKRGFVVGGIAVLVLAGLVVGFRGGKKAPPSFERPPAAVTLAVATARDVPVYMDEIGKTVARENVTVSPQVTGRLVEIRFTDGGDVRKGDLLFTIDPRPFQAQLDSALATLAQQKAELDLARTQYKRYADLVVTKAVSQAEHDIRKNAVAVDEAQVKQAEAAVETARLNLQYCTIRSPIDGRAGRRLVDIGNVVEANKTALLTIQKIDPIYADFTVNQNELTAVQDNMRRGTLKVEVRLQDEDDKPLPGQLTFLDNAVADATGTVQLRATVDNHERRLWPGRLVKVRLVLSTLKSAVLVPSVAPQMSAKGQFVYVVKDDSTAELRLVKTGQPQGDLVVIEEGVKPGEKVVVNGQLGVTPGGKVRDASAAPAAPAAPAAGKSAGGKP